MTRLLIALLLWPTLAVAAPIGPSISDELEAAGLSGLPFSWRPSDGTVRTDDPRLTEAQRQKIREVFAVHNPTTLSRAEIKATTKKQAKDNLAAQCQAASPTASSLEKALCGALSD